MTTLSTDREIRRHRRYARVQVQDRGSLSAGVCSGQLIPDSILRFSSAATGEMPSLNV